MPVELKQFISIAHNNRLLKCFITACFNIIVYLNSLIRLMFIGTEYYEKLLQRFIEMIYYNILNQ